MACLCGHRVCCSSHLLHRGAGFEHSWGACVSTRLSEIVRVSFLIPRAKNTPWLWGKQDVITSLTFYVISWGEQYVCMYLKQLFCIVRLESVCLLMSKCNFMSLSTNSSLNHPVRPVFSIQTWNASSAFTWFGFQVHWEFSDFTVMTLKHRIEDWKTLSI